MFVLLTGFGGVRAWPGAVCLAQSVGQGTAVRPAAPDEGPLRAAEADPEEMEAPASPTERLWRIVMRILIAAGVVAVLCGAVLLFFEERFVFRPSSEPASEWQPTGLAVEQCFFDTQDGVRLHGWWHPGPDRDDGVDCPVVLWCHGNAGNLTDREDNLRSLVASGLAVFIFDYRGYGRSEGSPSELGLYADVEAAYDYLLKERGIKPRRIVFFGRSLGAAVALHGALRRRAAGLIMESPFESVPAVVRNNIKIPFLALFIRNQFDNLIRMRMLRLPLLVIHGQEDTVVPYAHGQSVFAAAREPKEFYGVAGAGHEDTYLAGAAEWHRTFSDFCWRCVRGEAKRGPAEAEAEPAKEG